MPLSILPPHTHFQLHNLISTIGNRYRLLPDGSLHIDVGRKGHIYSNWYFVGWADEIVQDSDVDKIISILGRELSSDEREN